MKLAALAALVITLAGCARTVDAQPTKEPPPKLDCSLIFPAPSPNA